MIKWRMIFLVFIFGASCNKGPDIPSKIIKPEKMEEIFWDMIRGDILAQEITKRDSTKNIKEERFVLTEKIFLIHKITKTQFEESVAFYEKHPGLLKNIVDSLSTIKTRINIMEVEKKSKRLKDSHIFHPH